MGSMQPIGELNAIEVSKRECLQSKWLTQRQLKMKLFLNTLEMHPGDFVADIRPTSNLLQMTAALSFIDDGWMSLRLDRAVRLRCIDLPINFGGRPTIALPFVAPEQINRQGIFELFPCLSLSGLMRFAAHQARHSFPVELLNHIVFIFAVVG